jgi:hypothetical protein
VADYVLRDQGRDGKLTDYCRECRVRRQAVALLIMEFRNILAWDE